jgi:hypothetical protein
MSNNLTLLDLAKLNGADPIVGLIEEVATSSPEVTLIPARTIRGTSYKTVIRNSLPSVAFRAANEGTDPTKSKFTERLVEAFILSARVEVDKAVARGYEDGPEAIQAIEAAGVMRAALSTVGNQTIYGDAAGSKGFTGLQEMVAGFGSDLIVDAGGTTAGTGSSVYAIKAGNTGVQYVYGNGTTFDLSAFREGDAVDADGKRYAAFISDLTAWIGFQCVNKYAVGRLKTQPQTAARESTMPSSPSFSASSQSASVQRISSCPAVPHSSSKSAAPQRRTRSKKRSTVSSQEFRPSPSASRSSSPTPSSTTKPLANQYHVHHL